MVTMLPARRPKRLDDRGIALPLALLALIAVTVIVATAAITSGSELALSNAHQGGVSSLYQIDRVVDEYVAGQASAFGANASRPALVPGTYAVNDGKHSIVVTQLSVLDTVPPLRADSAIRRETISLVGAYSNPSTGDRVAGRRVGKLVLTRRAAGATSFNLQNGFVTGGDETTITGSSLVSGIQNRDLCQAGADSVAAVLHAAGTTVTAGEKNVIGDVDESKMNSDELKDHTLNGDSIMAIARSADIQFGKLFVAESFSTSAKPTSIDTTNHPVGSPYNWGCPGALDDANNCHLKGGDMTYYPTVAIDAEGGTVSLQGDHGQGVLIIVNGNLKITGNFIYRGIILVDGSMDVGGTGGKAGSTKIEGGVIATGTVTLSKDGANKISGNAMIQYNACEIANANRAMMMSRLDNGAQEFESGTTAWFEVIR